MGTGTFANGLAWVCPVKHNLGNSYNCMIVNIFCLQVGLAVGDIKTVQDEAELQLLSVQVC